jgi:hypothetical protein
MSPWIIPITILILSCIYLVFHEWKVKPALSNRQKNRGQEKKETKKQQKTNALNQQWQADKEILRNMREPLSKFNSLDRCARGTVKMICFEGTKQIKEQAQKIQRPEFQSIKTKLLEFAGRIDQIGLETSPRLFISLFQKKINDKYEPTILWEEIERILKTTAIPTFSENDL